MSSPPSVMCCLLTVLSIAESSQEAVHTPWQTADSLNASHGCSEGLEWLPGHCCSQRHLIRITQGRCSQRNIPLFIYAAVIEIISELYSLMYQLNELKLMTVNLCSYGADLWSNKNDKRHRQNRRFLVGTAEWECYTADSSGESFVQLSRFLSSSLSLIWFSSSVLQLKVMLLFQMAWCYIENRQEEYFIANMKICQHADIIMAAQII